MTAGGYFGRALVVDVTDGSAATPLTTSAKFAVVAAMTPSWSPAARLRRRCCSSTPTDVVQVKVSGGVATPLFGVSALLSVLTQADGYIAIPEEATGLDAGTEVTVTLYA